MGGPLDAWIRQPLALIHGEDADARKAAVAAWKQVHVDPEWEEFSLTVCAEACPWAEVVNALSEAAPFGASRVVIVPQADNLLAKPKDTPAGVLRWIDHPAPDLKLLLVARATLSAAPGKPLGAKPWNAWAKGGRVLKVGGLEGEDIPAFLEAEARKVGLRLDGGVAAALAGRLGGHPGILRRTIEVLDLMAEDEARAEADRARSAGPQGGAQEGPRHDRRITAELADAATFRLADQGAFVWSQAWQRGQVERALTTLRQAVEDDPGGAPLMLLGQARREVERLCALAEARNRGLSKPAELTEALGLSPKQGFLLDGYQRVHGRIKAAGALKLLALVNQADRDLKGQALGAPTVLTTLTVDLCRAWAG